MRILESEQEAVNRGLFVVPHDARLSLIVETSGRVGRLGLARGSQLIGERLLDETRRHARDLAPSVADLLHNFGARVRDVAAIFVSLGPGSYTGLRVGLISAKVLAYAADCALVGVPTFEAIASQSTALSHEFDVISDAQKGKLYVQRFVAPPGADIVQAQSELTIVAIRDWLALRPCEVGVTGPGLKIVSQLLPAKTPTAALDCCEAAVTGVLRAGWPRYVAGQRDDPFRLEPIYLRPSSAEEQWSRRPQ